MVYKRSRSDDMPFSRKKRAKVSTYKPKRVLRGINSGMTHKFTRWVTTESQDHLNLAFGATTLGFGKAFRLSHITGVTDFSTLFDQYKITNVQVNIRLITNPDSTTPLDQTSGAQSANFYPKLWFCHDYDDSSSPASLNQFREREGVKCLVMEPNKIVKYNVKPHVRMTGHGDLINWAYSPTASPWIDMANTSVDHYGFKMVFDAEGLAAAAANLWMIKVDYKYFLEFKQPQ